MGIESVKKNLLDFINCHDNPIIGIHAELDYSVHLSYIRSIDNGIHTVTLGRMFDYERSCRVSSREEYDDFQQTAFELLVEFTTSRYHHNTGHFVFVDKSHLISSSIVLNKENEGRLLSYDIAHPMIVSRMPWYHPIITRDRDEEYDQFISFKNIICLDKKSLKKQMKKLSKQADEIIAIRAVNIQMSTHKPFIIGIDPGCSPSMVVPYTVPAIESRGPNHRHTYSTSDRRTHLVKCRNGETSLTYDIGPDRYIYLQPEIYVAVEKLISDLKLPKMEPATIKGLSDKDIPAISCTPITTVADMLRLLSSNPEDTSSPDSSETIRRSVSGERQVNDYQCDEQKQNQSNTNPLQLPPLRQSIYDHFTFAEVRDGDVSYVKKLGDCVYIYVPTSVYDALVEFRKYSYITPEPNSESQNEPVDHAKLLDEFLDSVTVNCARSALLTDTHYRIRISSIRPGATSDSAYMQITLCAFNPETQTFERDKALTIPTYVPHFIDLNVSREKMRAVVWAWASRNFAPHPLALFIDQFTVSTSPNSIAIAFDFQLQVR